MPRLSWRIKELIFNFLLLGTSFITRIGSDSYRRLVTVRTERFILSVHSMNFIRLGWSCRACMNVIHQVYNTGLVFYKGLMSLPHFRWMPWDPSDSHHHSLHGATKNIHRAPWRRKAALPFDCTVWLYLDKALSWLVPGSIPKRFYARAYLGSIFYLQHGSIRNGSMIELLSQNGPSDALVFTLSFSGAKRARPVQIVLVPKPVLLRLLHVRLPRRSDTTASSSIPKTL